MPWWYIYMNYEWAADSMYLHASLQIANFVWIIHNIYTPLMLFVIEMWSIKFYDFIVRILFYQKQNI